MMHKFSRHLKISYDFKLRMKESLFLLSYIYNNKVLQTYFHSTILSDMKTHKLSLHPFLNEQIEKFTLSLSLSLSLQLSRLSSHCEKKWKEEEVVGERRRRNGDDYEATCSLKLIITLLPLTRQ